MIRATAIFSAHTIHLLHVIVRDTLIFLLVLFAALFVWLKSGIEIGHLHFNHYEVDGLYIKLDKKLTLKAAHVAIPKSKKRPSFDNIDTVLDRIKYMLTFFHYIELEKVDFKDNHYKLVYTDNILYLTSDDYEIAGNVWRKGKVLVADISLFYIKKEQINMVAKLNYDLHSDKLILEGKYEAYNIAGKFKAVKEGHTLSFILNSEPFEDLNTFIDRIGLKKSVNTWITRKVEAKRYRVYALSGKGRVNGSRFDLDLSSLKGDARLEAVKIHFKKELPPVTASSVLLHYENESLLFDLKDPRYERRDLKGSTVSITNMQKGKTAHLNLDLFLHTKVDAGVQKLLRAYDIKIPLLHNDARSKIEVKLSIPLKKKTSEKIRVSVKAALGKGVMHLQKLKLPVESGDVSYSKGVVTLKKIRLKSAAYEGVVSGKVYTRKKEAKLLLQVKHITLGEGKKRYFSMKEKELPLTLYYGKNPYLLIPSLKIRIEKKEKMGTTWIGAKDLALIKPYLGKVPVDFDGGDLLVWTKDFKAFNFKGKIARSECFLYTDKVCYTNVPVTGTFIGKDLELYAFDKGLHYSSKGHSIRVEGINIDMQRFLDFEQRKKRASGKTKRSGKLTIKGVNSKLRYDKYTLVTDRYRADIDFKSGNIRARGTLGSDVVNFIKKGKQIKIDALRIHDRMLHPLINFDRLQNGRYSITLSGDPEKVMKGEIRLEGGMLGDFKAYSSTRKFIRDDKALSKLDNTGFGVKGFRISEGQINYRIIKKEKVIFDSIYIKGDKATIVGKGSLNLRTKRLNIDLAVQTVRKLGKIVGSVPVLGYILMGEDNSITFALKISGTFDNPKVESSAAKEILTLPLDLIKRTLQSPAHILNTKKREKEPPKVMEEVVIPSGLVAP